jgi:hypothetical protein
VQAADLASRIDFNREGAGNYRGELGGPAAQLIRHLQNGRYDAHPYSVRPALLDSVKEHPHKMPGVAEARAALVAQVAEASR